MDREREREKGKGKRERERSWERARESGKEMIRKRERGGDREREGKGHSGAFLARRTARSDLNPPPPACRGAGV